MSKIRELQDRANTLKARIAALQAYKRRHGATDERSLRAHSAELLRIHAQITDETRAWEAAHPNPTRSTPRASRSAGPVPVAARARTLSRSERLDRIGRATAGDTGTLGYNLVRDMALRSIERRNLPPVAADRLDQLVRNRAAVCDGGLVARHIVVTGSQGYLEAYRAMLTQSTPALSPEAKAALEDFRDLQTKIAHRSAADAAKRYAAGETRAMNEATGADGGLAVPYYLDPALIPVSGLPAAQILGYARHEVITTNAWHGVGASSTGFTIEAEGSASADDPPTFIGPSIPLYTGRDWLPFSFELGMDQPNWVDNTAELFAASFAEFVSAQTATGSGSSAPTGIFTAMTNATTTPAHVTVTTAGTLGAVDLRAVWAALPERYRVDPSCAWVMSPGVEDRVSALSAPSQTNGLGPTDFTVDPNTGQRRLFGRPIMSIADAPALTGTTGAENFCVVGAFSKFVVATRVGSFVQELVPLVPDFSNGGRPSGERGYQATARLGSGVVTPDAFRLLANS